MSLTCVSSRAKNVGGSSPGAKVLSARLAPESLGAPREKILLWQLRVRKWWRFRGYKVVMLRQRPLKKFEAALLRKYDGA